jgi:BatD DUF11 like domain
VIRKILMLLIILFSMQTLYAAEFNVYIDSNETYVGQALELTMQISSNQVLKRPHIANIDGFQLSPAGESRYEQRSLGGGANSRTVTMEYSWHLMPLKTGNLTIPSFELELEDEILKSSEIDILVREPGAIEGYFLFLSAREDTVFPGLPVRVTLKWLFSSEVSRPEFTLPFLNQKKLKVEDLSPPSSKSSDIFQFSVEGRTIYAVQSAEIFEGEQYASLTISWNIYPEIEGVLELEPVFLSFQRTVVNKQGRKSYAPAVIPSNGLNLNVKEVPGELNNFPGGILVADDNLDIKLSLDQTRVYPGDPLELTLSMSGLSSPELTDFKGFSNLKEFKGIVKVDSGSLISELNGKSRIYKQKIRIETDRLDVFPSITIPYYNLKKRTVEQVVTAEIPLTLLSLDDSVSEPVEIQGGFLNWNTTANDENSIALRANHRVRSSSVKSIILNYGLQIVLVLFFLTLIILLLPSLLKGVTSIRFGRKEADIRLLLKKAVKVYEFQPVSENGQALYDLLLRWSELRDPDMDEELWFKDLTLSLEQSLWDQNSDESIKRSDIVIESIKDNLIKYLNKGRVK